MLGREGQDGRRSNVPGGLISEARAITVYTYPPFHVYAKLDRNMPLLFSLYVWMIDSRPSQAKLNQGKGFLRVCLGILGYFFFKSVFENMENIILVFF